MPVKKEVSLLKIDNENYFFCVHLSKENIRTFPITYKEFLYYQGQGIPDKTPSSTNKEELLIGVPVSNIMPLYNEFLERLNVLESRPKTDVNDGKILELQKAILSLQKIIRSKFEKDKFVTSYANKM